MLCSFGHIFFFFVSATEIYLVTHEEMVADIQATAESVRLCICSTLGASSPPLAVLRHAAHLGQSLASGGVRQRAAHSDSDERASQSSHSIRSRHASRSTAARCPLAPHLLLRQRYNFTSPIPKTEYYYIANASSIPPFNGLTGLSLREYV